MNVSSYTWVALLSVATGGCNLLLGIEAGELHQPDAGRCVGDACDPQAGSGGSMSQEDGGRAGTAGASMDGGLASDSGPASDGGPGWTTDGGDCRDGARRCAGEAETSALVCVEGEWAEDACPTGERCDNRTGACAPIAEGCAGRDPGETFCIGRDRIQCGADLVTRSVERCPTSAHCSGSQSSGCLPCVEDEHRCDGDSLQRCRTDQSGFEHVEDCPPGECNALLAQCTTDVCAAGEWSCDRESNELQRCNADGTDFEESYPCDDGECDATNARCDVCTPNQSTCASEATRSECDESGQTLVETDCATVGDGSTPFCRGEGECVPCSYPSADCIDLSNRRQCQADGTWGSAISCGSQTCVDGACIGSCGPGQSRCHEGARQVCNEHGQWETSIEACPICEPAGPGAARCVMCRLSPQRDYECRGDRLFRCRADQTDFEQIDQCETGLCDESLGRCENRICNPLQVSCEGPAGNVLTTCNSSGTEVTQETCSGSTPICYASGHTGECRERVCEANQYSCSGATLRQCNERGDGYLPGTQQCASASLCDAVNGRCNICTPNTTRCANNVNRATCASDGQSETTNACPNFCHAGECVACQPNVGVRCVSGRYHDTCNSSGSWSRLDCHQSGQVCFDLACRGECITGRYQCSAAGNSQVCDGTGNWQANETCTSSPPQRCDDDLASATYGRCIANPPFNVGNSNAGGTVYNLFDDQIMAQPIVMPHDATLIALGMRTTPTSSGGSAYLSIHRDNAGEPGAIINRTNQFPIISDSGNLNSRVWGQPSDTNLVSGTRYWVVARISEPPTANVRVYINPASSAGNFRTATMPFGVPANLNPGDTGPSTGEVTLYIQVRR